MLKEETELMLKKIEEGEIGKPKMLLHACCAPCTTGVLYQLTNYFDVTILYYNPNIYPKEEYDLRYENLIQLSKLLNFKIIEFGYDEQKYLSLIKGYEDNKEGGERCHICYKFRLEETAKYAQTHNFDIFTTTLSVSPYKNALVLNNQGNELESKYNVKYFYSDFKKHDGYKNSIKFSKEYGLYRQDYCGCRFSLNDKNNRTNK